MNAESQAPVPTEAQAFRLPNATPLINRTALRDFLLETAKSTRAHPFSRVSQETIIKLHEILRAAAVGHIKHLPSKGKTI